MINWMSVRNFRSIERQEFDCNWITTFVGENDAGKSNILRALNLFFNGYTDSGIPFIFERDFDKFASVGQRKARQIEITMNFALPEGYHRDNLPTEVEWRKVWRDSGLVPEMGYRQYVSGVDFPSRSKIPTLLDRIRFTYIPAIKDQQFFADLQGQLYDALASVASGPLRQSATDFEQQIQQQLQELLASLTAAFSAESTMRLPDNLRAIFESLEISTDGIPLSRRGDGIKIRHIPMILKFIADKHDTLLNKGGVRYTHIWGFEEPENNVEMSACFEMANQFLSIIENSDRHQLFLTTHSPIFYGMEDPGESDEDDEPWVRSYFVQKEGHSSKIIFKPPFEVDESMGLMPLVVPYVEQAKKQYDHVRQELSVARQIAEGLRPTLFLEGSTDELVIAKALEIYAPAARERINLKAGGDAGYGSANALASRSLAWLLEMRHRPTANRVRAMSIFDADEAGKNARNKLNTDIGNLKIRHAPHFKIHTLNTPPRLRSLAAAHFQLSVDLEAYYVDPIWEHAEQQHWIEQAEDPRQGLSETMVRQFFETKQDPRDNLAAADLRRIRNKFTDNGKVRAAQYVTNLPNAEASAALANFEPLIDEIVAHLLPEN